jgi:hypothetical protein
LLVQVERTSTCFWREAAGLPLPVLFHGEQARGSRWPTAIALRTGRPKDHNRILQFIEQRAMDPKKLQLILARHNLNSKWEQFERRFLEGKHG